HHDAAENAESGNCEPFGDDAKAYDGPDDGQAGTDGAHVLTAETGEKFFRLGREIVKASGVGHDRPRHFSIPLSAVCPPMYKPVNTPVRVISVPRSIASMEASKTALASGRTTRA